MSNTNGIPKFTSSPINSNTATASAPDGPTPQTAPSAVSASEVEPLPLHAPMPATATATPSALPPTTYPAAQPGSVPAAPAPAPAPARTSSSPYIPTKTACPPPPQPGARPDPFPTPISTPAKPPVPPPPKAGEIPPAPTTTTTTSTLPGPHRTPDATTTTEPISRPAPNPTSSSPYASAYQPPGPYAAGPHQRSYPLQYNHSARDERVFVGGGDDEPGILDTARSWMKSAGAKLAEVEAEVWKRINDAHDK